MRGVAEALRSTLPKAPSCDNWRRPTRIFVDPLRMRILVALSFYNPRCVSTCETPRRSIAESFAQRILNLEAKAYYLIPGPYRLRGVIQARMRIPDLVRTIESNRSAIAISLSQRAPGLRPDRLLPPPLVDVGGQEES